MQRIIPTLLFLTLVLCAWGTSISPTDTIQPTAAETTSPPTISGSATESFSDSPALPIPRFSNTLQTPHIDQPPDGNPPTISPTFEGCGYQWAYEDLPKLSSDFQQSIQELQLEAQANAYAFGEDCIYADGHSTFSAMETDFNITLQVNDLSDEADLGEWIVKIMQVIENVPQDEIIGPRPGLVSIIFRSGSAQKPVNFYIDQYQNLPSGLSNAEIYQALQLPQ